MRLLLAAAVWLLAPSLQAQGAGSSWFDAELGPGLSGLTGYTVGLAPGDFDGDGEVDLLFRQDTAGVLLRGDGFGSFDALAGAVPPLPGTGFGLVEAGDLDADGDLDAVLARNGAVDALLNDGSAHFALGPAVQLFVYPPIELRLADLDGDGLLDLAGALLQGEYRPGDGAGGFGAPVVLAPFLNDLYAEDLDGDGDLDLLLLAGSSSPARVLRNDGAGGFQDAQALAPGSEAALGDFDADADPDLFLAADYDDGHRVYRLGASGFVLAQHLPGTLPFLSVPSDADVTDYDEDGDLDVVVAHVPGTGQAWSNDGAGLFALETGVFPPLALLEKQNTFVDVEGDGDEDLVCAGFDSELLLCDGHGAFVAIDNAVAGAVRDAAGLADVDGDGDVDAFSALGEFDAGLEWLYRNDGLGNLVAERSPAPSVDYVVSSYDLGDLDLDGDNDVLIGRFFVVVAPPLQPLPVPLTALENDGTGAFVETPASIVAPPGVSHDVLLLDTEGDGDLDAFSANYGHDENRLLLNDGSGKLEHAPSKLPPDPSTGIASASGDFDLDGDLDLLIARAGTSKSPPAAFQDRLFLNDGVGAFSDATSTHMPVLGTDDRVLLVEDVDLDGDPDGYLLVANFATSFGGLPQRDVLLRNDGSGHLTNASADLPPLSNDPFTGVFTDVDLDGDPDLLRGCQGTLSGKSQPTELYVNDGAGVFTAGPEPVPAWQTLTGTALAAFDFDRDGDEDLLTSERFFRSLRRELSPLTLPRIGHDFDLELRSHGAPSSYLVAFSVLPAEIDLGSFGILGLAAPKVIAAGPLDGHAVASVPIPSQPSLVGVEVLLQALMDLPPHFSRVLAAEITDL